MPLYLCKAYRRPISEICSCALPHFQLASGTRSAEIRDTREMITKTVPKRAIEISFMATSAFVPMDASIDALATKKFTPLLFGQFFNIELVDDVKQIIGDRDFVQRLTSGIDFPGCGFGKFSYIHTIPYLPMH